VAITRTVGALDAEGSQPERSAPFENLFGRPVVDPLPGHHDVVQAVGRRPPEWAGCYVLVEQQAAGLHSVASGLQERPLVGRGDVVQHVDHSDHMVLIIRPRGTDVAPLELEARWDT
jgi:hypothetical protein